MSKKIFFDLDGVLCDRPKGIEELGIEKYTKCFPIESRIDLCNRLYKAGHHITIFTSRGMTSLGGDIKKIIKQLKPLTVDQLELWGVKYHELIMGKPHYDILIDDKVIDPNEHDSSLLNKAILKKL